MKNILLLLKGTYFQVLFKSGIVLLIIGLCGFVNCKGSLISIEENFVHLSHQFKHSPEYLADIEKILIKKVKFEGKKGIASLYLYGFGNLVIFVSLVLPEKIKMSKFL